VKSVVKKRDVRAKDAGDAEKSLTTDSTDDTDGIVFCPQIAQMDADEESGRKG